MQTPATYVKFLELYPCLPSYTYMFMLEAMTYKVDTSHFIIGSYISSSSSYLFSKAKS